MSKRKVSFPEEVEEKFEEFWDFKKILIGVATLLISIFGEVVVSHLLFHQPITPASFIPPLPNVTAVKGVSTGPTSVPIHLPSAQDVQNQVQNLQNQVTHLNVAEVATSSPQVKQILQQIENLPSGPESQVKDACVRLCNNL